MAFSNSFLVSLICDTSLSICELAFTVSCCDTVGAVVIGVVIVSLVVAAYNIKLHTQNALSNKLVSKFKC